MRAPAFDVAAPVAATVGAPLRRPAGRGRPLDPAVRERMAAAFGTGFDAVRVHTDGASDAFNREVSASASTLGDHIYFRSGAYQPGTGAGQRLLAHELTHVVQQRGSRGGAPRLGPIGGTAEAQADAAAARVAAGGSVDAGALAPVAAGTVQRKYLDAASFREGWTAFYEDTKSRKSTNPRHNRGQLAKYDSLLQDIYAADPALPQYGRLLDDLEEFVQQSKYLSDWAKGTDTFDRRRSAFLLLLREIAEARSRAGWKKAPSTTTTPQVHESPSQSDTGSMATFLSVPPDDHWSIVHPEEPEPIPGIRIPEEEPEPEFFVDLEPADGSQAAQVSDLRALAVELPYLTLQQLRAQRAWQLGSPSQLDALYRTLDAALYLERVVGLDTRFIDQCYPIEINGLCHASLALRAGQPHRAQAIFDMLNPPSKATGHERPKGWRPDGFDMVRPGVIFDIKRDRADMLSAQRQLMVHHAQDIGGLYGQLMTYKPYSPTKGNAPLTDAEARQGARYFNAAELRDWGTLITYGDKGFAPLKDAKELGAKDEAEEYDTASAKRQEAKGLAPKPKRKALEPDEVTALRIYTADEYREINAVLRDFRIGNPTANWLKYSAIARLAISGLYKLPKVRNTVSYRGDDDLSHSGNNLLLQRGRRFHTPFFYSTSVAPGAAFPGALGYVFINRKRGRDVSPFSAVPGEGEILIPPGTPFEVIEEWRYDSQTWLWREAGGAVGLRGFAKLIEKAPPNHYKRTTILVLREIV
ncbi:eCIS core domain-containing protein [Pseudonocardia sp. CA-107938]|uniref:eCIS core domain-containing protein n=1 Tax=Pseudonocardia sp. CA-107938 TaxID=3240021 RepID=UPI003D8B4401